MRIISFLLIGLGSAVILSGCSSPDLEFEAMAAGRAAEPLAWSDGATRVIVAEDSAQFAPVPSNAEPRFIAEPGRKMIYNANLTIAVDNQSAALNAAREITKERKGYMENLNDFIITLRIPMDQADNAMTEIEKLGTVTRRQISGEDVTKVVTDIEIRLDNLKKLRVRLTELLERGEKVEDLLKIETELSRTTTEIERIQAQLRDYQNRIAYLTLTVTFEARAIQVDPSYFAAIPWVNDLGNSLEKQNISMNSSKKTPYDIDFPEDFVQVFGSSDMATAISADDCVIKLTRRANLKGGTPKFWNSLISRALTERNNYEIVRRVQAEIDGLTTDIITAERKVGRSSVKYQILIAISKEGFFTSSKIYLMEVWGPKEQFDKIVPELPRIWESMEF